jgi:hypothetical protein
MKATSITLFIIVLVLFVIMLGVHSAVWQHSSPSSARGRKPSCSTGCMGESDETHIGCTSCSEPNRPLPPLPPGYASIEQLLDESRPWPLEGLPSEPNARKAELYRRLTAEFDRMEFLIQWLGPEAIEAEYGEVADVPSLRWLLDVECDGDGDAYLDLMSERRRATR